MTDSTSRRQFLASAGAVLGLAPVMAACGGAPSQASQCDGYSALSTAELGQRRALNYVDQTPEAGQNCLNCRLYNAPAEGASCGGCQLFPGPVVAQGWCTAWAAVAA